MQKRTIFALTLVAALGAAACGTSAPPEKFKQKLVILGFDGMEPSLVQKWMGEGKLPNFKRLSDRGGFYRLQTTTSPESPVSWASFATGSNPAKHNIFDFLVRNVKTYFPDYGLVETVEIKGHPWFLSCQFHPEFKSKPLKPHPLFKAFIGASRARRLKTRKG